MYYFTIILINSKKLKKKESNVDYIRMNQSEPKESQVPQTVQISHLQLLINAVVLAYHRNAYTLKEAGTIWKALEFFINSGNAMMPQVQMPQVQKNDQPQAQPIVSTKTNGNAIIPQVQKEDQPQVSPVVSTKTNVPATHVSSIGQVGQKTSQTVHTIQPEESKQDSNLILNVVNKQ